MSLPSNIQPKFKKGSIFYQPSEEELTIPEESMMISPSSASSENSKNSIFSQDFTSIPPSKRLNTVTQNDYPPSPSKNSIFDQDFAISPISVSSKMSFERSDTDKYSAEKVKFRRSSLPHVIEHISSGSNQSKIALQQSSSLNTLVEEYDAENVTPEAASLKYQNINLTIIPIRKNFIGEGRFSKVYKGYYSEKSGSSSVSPIESNNASFYTQSIQNKQAYSNSSSLASSPVSSYSDSQVKCAVKVIHANDEDASKFGLSEAYILHKIQSFNEQKGHQNIIKFIGLKYEILKQPEIQENKRFSTQSNKSGTGISKQIMLIMEYCQNGNLFDYIVSNPKAVNRKTWLLWCQQIASALEFLHTGNHGLSKYAILHHDIKPQNILLDDQLQCKLADFGAAALVPLDQDIKLNDGIGKGTQAYTAPEVLTGTYGGYFLPSDIYSLGCTFFTLLTGKEPFADIRNPGHQLICIQKGFFESGVNALTEQKIHTSPINVQQQFSLPQIYKNGKEPISQSLSVPSSALSSPYAFSGDSEIFQFLSGDQLRADLKSDAEAWIRIQSLLKKCLSLNPNSRPSASKVIADLNQIADVLLPENASDCNSPNPLQVLPTVTPSPEKIQKVQGGRKPMFLQIEIN